MDPPASPTKFPMSPGMPLFPVSPERVAGTKPPYNGPTPPSPSLPDLRTSPIRGFSHRRNDSDVTVHGLAAMFENLEVKDFKEAQAKYLASLQRLKSKHASEIRDMEIKHKTALSRYEVRLEELKVDAKRTKETVDDSVPRETWDKLRQDNREAIAKWEKAMQYSEEKRKQAEKKAHEFSTENNVLQTKLQQYKKKNLELSKENMRATSYIPTIQAKFQSLERNARIIESDLKFQTGEAEKYKNQVYGLQVDLESVESRLSEEIQTLKDKLMIVEGERDALKTSLKEEEVMRIAAEGQIALPAMTAEENDEFGSPVRSPRKRNPERDEEDKENVAPRKTTVEIKFLQQELASEKRLRERAQEQIDFMKMECQFQCCSCRVADLKGSHYVHDNSYAMEIEMIKASVPTLTPPSSTHGDETVEGVVIKQEPVEDDRLATAPSEAGAQSSEDQEDVRMDRADESETVDFSSHPPSVEAEPAVAFSPTTGTFRSFPSPVKAPALAPQSINTPSKNSLNGLSAITEMPAGSSPWTPDANSTVIPPEPASPSLSVSRTESGRKQRSIPIHEDAIMDDEDDEDMEPRTPLHDPSGPATPAHYIMRTVTMTTKIPLHFSPMTPAIQKSDKPMTPSTIAHAPTNAQAQAQVLGELSLNKLPFDREAALEAIRERRGRARSMAAGHGTPMKQMLGGVMERRDISAPVSRVRR